MGVKKVDIVTIDGPAGSGKSTIARIVAKHLDYMFLDTGAMYRAVAYGALRMEIATSDFAGLKAYLESTTLDIRYESDCMRVFLDQQDVTEIIRQPEMGQHASDYSRVQAVREFCTLLQRRIGLRGRIVCEGRDMGTVVFPEARWKYFMTASVSERAVRRWRELVGRGESVDLEAIQDAIEKRDFQDENRMLAPLKPAADAIILDTTYMTIQEVVNRIITDVHTPPGPIH